MDFTELLVTTSDGLVTKVPMKYAVQSNYMKSYIENMTSNELSITNFDKPTLDKFVEFLHLKKDEPKMTERDIMEFKQLDKYEGADADFFKIDRNTLLGWINCANFLDCEMYLLYTVKALAFDVEGCDCETFRRIFGVENDWDPEQEEMIKREFKWAEEHLTDDIQ